MLKQLRPASFILVLYRIHSKPKPSSFAFILFYFFDSCCSFASGLHRDVYTAQPGCRRYLHILSFGNFPCAQKHNYPQAAFSDVSNVLFIGDT